MDPNRPYGPRPPDQDADCAAAENEEVRRMEEVGADRRRHALHRLAEEDHQERLDPSWLELAFEGHGDRHAADQPNEQIRTFCKQTADFGF